MKKKKYIIIAVGVAVILGATAFGIHFASKPSLPNTYAELIALPPEKIEQVDIALMNLLCAEGLPGTENLNIACSLQTRVNIRKNSSPGGTGKVGAAWC